MANASKLEGAICKIVVENNQKCTSIVNRIIKTSSFNVMTVLQRYLLKLALY